MALMKYGEKLVDLIEADGGSFSEGTLAETRMEMMAEAFEVDTVPTPTSTGSPGQHILSGTTLYLCVADDTWVQLTVTTSW